MCAGLSLWNAIEYHRLLWRHRTWVRALLVIWPMASFSVTLFFFRAILTRDSIPLVAPWLDALWRMGMAILFLAANAVQAMIFALGLWPRDSEGG